MSYLLGLILAATVINLFLTFALLGGIQKGLERAIDENDPMAGARHARDVFKFATRVLVIWIAIALFMTGVYHLAKFLGDNV